MELEIGSVVRCAAGHDKGRLMAVTGFCGGEILLCDGKRRKLEKPKQKNPKHVYPTRMILGAEETATNRGLIKALARCEHEKRNEE